MADDNYEAQKADDFPRYTAQLKSPEHHRKNNRIRQAWKERERKHREAENEHTVLTMAGFVVLFLQFAGADDVVEEGAPR